MTPEAPDVWYDPMKTRGGFPLNEEKTPTGIAVARLTAVLGMAFTATAAILLFIGGWLVAGGIALLGFVPFFLLMRYLERRRSDEG